MRRSFKVDLDVHPAPDGHWNLYGVEGEEAQGRDTGESQAEQVHWMRLGWRE